MYSFSYLEPVCCSMSSSNCCFLTCIQISYEAGQVVWSSHLFKNFPQFIVIHTVKGFCIINKAEIDFFWNTLAFLMNQRMLATWFLVPLPFLKPAWTSGSSLNFSIYFPSIWWLFYVILASEFTYVYDTWLYDSPQIPALICPLDSSFIYIISCLNLEQLSQI